MTISVVVVGAGVAGLATAIGLARHGHQVTVIEKRQYADREQSGSAIQLASNATRILKHWDMAEDMLAVSLENESLDVRQWDTGEHWGYDYAFTKHGAWFALRKDIRDVFRSVAARNGATLRDGATVVEVDSTRPAVILEDGTTIEADLVVSGDGSFSKVRQNLFPDSHPDVLDTVCHQVTVPLDTIMADPEMKTLVSGSSPVLWMSPGRHIIAASIYKRNIYETQLLQEHYPISEDPQSQILQGRIDVQVLRDMFKDHPSDLRKLLTQVDTCWKWRIVEVLNVPAWSSDNGKVILVGDSVHAMRPYAAQGAAMGIEDGAVLSELLVGAQKGDDFSQIAKLYEEIRRPRAETITRYATMIGQMVMTTDPNVRNMLKENIAKGIKPDYDACEADPNAAFHTDAFRKWVYYYDVLEDTQKICNERARNGEGLAKS